MYHTLAGLLQFIGVTHRTTDAHQIEQLLVAAGSPTKRRGVPLERMPRYPLDLIFVDQGPSLTADLNQSGRQVDLKREPFT